MPMKCDRLLNDALNLHIDPEARATLNAVPKDKAIVDNKLQEAANGMQIKKKRAKA